MPLKHIVNDEPVRNIIAFIILHNDIILLNLIRSELEGVKKNAGWIVNDAKCEWVEGSDQSIRPLSFPVRNSYGKTGELLSGYERPNSFLDRSR